MTLSCVLHAQWHGYVQSTYSTKYIVQGLLRLLPSAQGTVLHTRRLSVRGGALLIGRPDTPLSGTVRIVLHGGHENQQVHVDGGCTDVVHASCNTLQMYRCQSLVARQVVPPLVAAGMFVLEGGWVGAFGRARAPHAVLLQDARAGAASIACSTTDGWQVYATMAASVTGN